MPTRPLCAPLLAALLLLLAGCIFGQDPFTEHEFDQFLSHARVVKQAAGKLKLPHFERYGILPSPALAQAVSDEARRIGWGVDRYNYIYDRCVAYGAMIQAERDAEEGGKTMKMIESVMGNTLPEGSDYMLLIVEKQIRILTERVMRDIPVSERSLIHDRIDDVMDIVLQPHILAAMPEVDS